MPIEQSTQPAAGTTRRTFLVRSAVGGAIAAAGVAAPLAGVTPFAGLSLAGAQEGELLTDEEFAAFAVPFEMAAVQAYEQALGSGLLVGTDADHARAFQTHHQTVADALAPLLDPEAEAPVADPQAAADAAAAIEAAADAVAVAGVLASFEETLAATHLAAIPALRDPITARTVIQVAAVESQQAALLGAAAGTDLAVLTPAEATTDGAISPGDATGGTGTSETTTTTEAGAATTTSIAD